MTKFLPVVLGIAATFVIPARDVSAQGRFDVLHTFTSGEPMGPAASVIQASDGNLYGLSNLGRIHHIFKVTPAGVLTVLHAFDPATDGALPKGALVQGSDGALYGTASLAGSNNKGTAFKITTSGAFTVLHAFDGGPTDGSRPGTALVEGTDGNFYGALESSGSSTNNAAVFRMTPPGAVTVLHTFTGGISKVSDLIQASDGNFYGTTRDGFGEIAFRMTADGTTTTLHGFNGSLEGSHPSALVQGTDGNLYGTTSFGGGLAGAAFKMTLDGAVTVLHQFVGGANDGRSPFSGLIQGADGNFYGTTDGGGTSSLTPTIFKMTPAGAVTILHFFDDATSDRTGDFTGGLTRAANGNFYGTTQVGGPFGAGMVYEITPTGTFSMVRGFITDGAEPTAAIVQGGDGHLYGTTSSGTVFKVRPDGALTGLRAFLHTRQPFPNPPALVASASGDFYGGFTSEFNLAVVYRMTPTGTITLRRGFDPLRDRGFLPLPLMQATDGNLYGMMGSCAFGCNGLAYRLTPTGGLTILSSLASPAASFIQGTDGNLYGTTAGGGTSSRGTVFRMTTAGVVTVLHTFAGGSSDGASPVAALVQSIDGNFYGTTVGGGPLDLGTVFRMTPDGAVTILHAFAGGAADGAKPRAALVQAPDGMFFGTTSTGGPSDKGTIFKMTPAGDITIVHAFTGGTDGANPVAPLLRTTDGGLYGTARGGGVAGFGVVFRLSDPPAITLNPSALRVTGGQVVQFTAAASGLPVPTVQWQVSGDGGTAFINIPGATSSAYVFTADLFDNAKQFRAVFTNVAGAATTRATTLIVRRASGRPAPSDLDGDGRADLVVWRPGSGTWFSLHSGSVYNVASPGVTQWGSKSAGDVPLMGDIDGDGIGDLIVWRASTGTWFWLTSSTGYSYLAAQGKQWGNQSLGDVPMLADMDGDGRSDLVLWRASTGTWFWLTSSSGYDYAFAGVRQWGNAALGDVPLLEDVDGDRIADLIVWRASTGTWFWLTSSSGYVYAAAGAKQWGNASLGDVPLTADMDGDGQADLVVWRTSTGTWFWLPSRSGYAYGSAVARQWGNQALGDVALLSDFDGDGKGDLTIWRASTGTWFVLTSSSSYLGAVITQWGSQANEDVPIVK